jgi:hypothetical protein
MIHKLLLDVPEDVYESLAKTAKQTGQSLEDLAVSWLENATRRLAEDPFEKFIGSINSNTADWADQHDKYLGESLAETMKDGKSDDDPDA